MSMKPTEGFKDLSEFFDPDLKIPVRGKVYRIPAPNALDGLRLRKAFNDPSAHYTDDDEIEEWKLLLGPVWDEMIEDGIDWKSLSHVGRTAMFYYGLGETLAQVTWQTGLGDSGNPLPPKPGDHPN